MNASRPPYNFSGQEQVPSREEARTAKKRMQLRTLLLILAGAGTVIVAAILLVLWLFITPAAEDDPTELEAQAPESYEAIFEVFMQARANFQEGDDFEHLLEDEDFVLEDESLSEDHLNDDYLAEEDWDADDFAEAENTYLDENEESTEYGFDEEGFLEDDGLYFDEGDVFQELNNISVDFSGQDLIAMTARGAQNSGSLVAFSADDEGSYYLYVISGKNLDIVRVTAEGSLESIGTISADVAADTIDTQADSLGANKDLSTEYFTNLFLTDNRLIALRATVFNANFELNLTEDEPDNHTNSVIAEEPFEDYTEQTTVLIFDLSTAAAPELITSYTVTGTYLGSRMLGTMLYLVTDYGVFDYKSINLDAPETFVPFVTQDNDLSLVAPTDIRIAADVEYRDTNYTHVAGIDVSGDTEIRTQVAFLGGSDVIYTAAESMYLATSTFQDADGTDDTIISHIIQVEIVDDTLSFGQDVSIPGLIEEPAQLRGITIDDPASVELRDDFGTDFSLEILIPWMQTAADTTEAVSVDYWLSLDEIEFEEGIEDADDSGITLGMYRIEGTAGDSRTEIHSTTIEGQYFTNAFFDTASLFADAQSPVIAFPTDSDYLIYTYSETDGFSRVKLFGLAEEADPNASVRAMIAGNHFIVAQISNNLEVWSLTLSDFEERDQLRLTD
ncbi:MAG: beta-propeller domain-containing protein [Coriobacteriia bacterium]|nr:beta-propeller domain-containing protein [Coriobacteriia bacterium]